MKEEDLKLDLDKVNISDIKSILIRTVGLLDIFGKLIIDITYNDDSKQTIEVLSPVPTQTIAEWLDTNKLLDKTQMYKF